MGKKCCCRLSGGILLVSTLLQIAAIAAPGWTVLIKGNTDTYQSIFYTMKCSTLLKEECKARTHSDVHHAKRTAMVKADVSNAKLAYVGEYTTLVISPPCSLVTLISVQCVLFGSI